MNIFNWLDRLGNWVYEMSGHSELDRLESKFKFGDKVEIIDGFYKGQKGIITKLHPATTLSHGWVGYWVKFDNGIESKEAICPENITKMEV